MCKNNSCKIRTSGEVLEIWIQNVQRKLYLVKHQMTSLSMSGGQTMNILAGKKLLPEE